jgi:hypothetical protein
MGKSDNPADSFLFSVELAANNFSPEQDDSFWTHEEIDATRWNKAFPFQFMLVRADNKGNFYQDQEARQWTYTLPFPPSSLSISMPFAIAGAVTQGRLCRGAWWSPHPHHPAQRQPWRASPAPDGGHNQDSQPGPGHFRGHH